ncbi:hypothetical protein OG401_35445 [Kitasatospora purpeofusca]|uniref:hypothetical protein n=1 Tax=Kitasatospora purpeofusca TaxID=67352 RepID=UPI00225A4A09|nr:hypothetical protein [Kitasatospora purpeofusca]MCX4689531.1 hypothetical protein [Kitasatospora purpeofusca]
MPGTTTLIGIGGVLVLLAVLAHLTARRAGGWRALRRRLRRELAVTAGAFAAPFAARLRYGRQLRTVRRLLADRAGWADAERAALGAGRVAGARPYAVLLGAHTAGVLVACGPGTPPVPPEPWVVDEADPRLWWAARDELRSTAADGGPAPLLALIGTDGPSAVLLDLATGPAVTEFGGDRVLARAVVQAVAAQLDARLPVGAVVVADGVHARHAGPAPVEALAEADRFAADGEPAFAVCPAAPDGFRPAAGARMLVLGGARGSARLVTVDRDGLRLRGTALRVEVVALARATARILRALPPYPAFAPAELDESDLVEPGRVPAEPEELEEFSEPEESPDPPEASSEPAESSAESSASTDPEEPGEPAAGPLPDPEATTDPEPSEEPGPDGELPGAGASVALAPRLFRVGPVYPEPNEGSGSGAEPPFRVGPVAPDPTALRLLRGPEPAEESGGGSGSVGPKPLPETESESWLPPEAEFWPPPNPEPEPGPQPDPDPEPEPDPQPDPEPDPEPVEDDFAEPDPGPAGPAAGVSARPSATVLLPAARPVG